MFKPLKKNGEDPEKVRDITCVNKDRDLLKLFHIIQVDKTAAFIAENK